MSIIGKMILDGQSFNLLSYRNRFFQQRDIAGRPRGRVNGGLIEVKIEAHRDHMFHHWALQPEQMRDLELYFSPVTKVGNSRVIQLYDVYCARMAVYFDNYTSNPMTYTLLLSPGIYVDGGVVFKKPWHVTDLEAMGAEVTEEPEAPKPKVLSVKWVDENDIEKKEIRYGEKISLQVEIDNKEGDIVQITIERGNGSDFESGTSKMILKEPIDENYTAQLTEFIIRENWEETKGTGDDVLLATVTYESSFKKSMKLKLLPIPKVIVDFRPDSKYKGDYGFDYIRDKANKSDSINYEDIVGMYDGKTKAFKKNTSYFEDLRDKEYKIITFPWYKDAKNKPIPYPLAWLAIYPNQEVTLSLQVNVIENQEELSFEYDKALLQLSKQTIPSGGPKGKTRLNDFLKIKCLKEFATDQKIKVMYQNRQMGQLNLLKNDKTNRYKANVVFVNMRTEITSGIIKKGNSTGEKVFLAKYMKQALIKADISEQDFDLTIVDSKTKKPKYPDFVKNYTLNHRGKIKLNKYHKNTTKDNLVTFTEKEFNKAFPKFKDYFKIYFYGDKGARKNGANFVGLAGYAKAIDAKSVIVFDGRNKATATHELLHAMSLHHTFSNNSKYTYKKGETYNIMDYSHLSAHGSKARILTWYWQWLQLQKKVEKE